MKEKRNCTNTLHEGYEEENGDFYMNGHTYRRITGSICRQPETLNRQGKSSVTYSDGTIGAVWCKKEKSYGIVRRMVEYKGRVYGYIR